MGYRLSVKLLILLMILKDVAGDTLIDPECANIGKFSAIESQINSLKSLISDQDIIIARQSTKIAEQDTTIANLPTNIAEQNAKIAQQDTTIANLRADIAGQDTKIAQQDTTIAGQDTKIAQQDTTIAGQNTKIAQQDTTIANLRADIAGQNTKLVNQETGSCLPQDCYSVLDKLNETQIVQANQLTELKTLLWNTTHTLDGEDKKLNSKIEKFISTTRQLNTTLLTLKSKERETIYNIAAGKTTVQSSTYGLGTSQFALDNNWGGDYTVHGCSFTLPDANPPAWWRVDLAERHEVYAVVIKNRADNDWDRILDAKILVGDEKHYEVCGTFNGPTFAGEVRHVSCNPTLQGRYVKIQQTRVNYLQLCEVAVYGYPLSD